MDIAFNSKAAGGVWRAEEVGTVSVRGAAGAASGAQRADFTMTSRVASQDEIEAAGIPDDALSRDDALGRLVSTAFNFKPPAIDFSSLDA